MVFRSKCGGAAGMGLFLIAIVRNWRYLGGREARRKRLLWTDEVELHGQIIAMVFFGRNGCRGKRGHTEFVNEGVGVRANE
ncbi:hypothetical protein KCP77_12770 [Salmonella enterica subsp. enterica]|nr:hypothetical protein KCP77_12770 [Salmonella enterica subsp. enterica]